MIRRSLGCTLALNTGRSNYHHLVWLYEHTHRNIAQLLTVRFDMSSDKKEGR